MTDLSPAAQAVAAFNERHELCGPFDDDWVEQCLAAALEDVADQVAPGPWRVNSCCDQREHSIRGGILAIAAELRGGTTITTTETL